MAMLCLKFFLGLNFIFLCFKLIIIHYHTTKQRKIKFKPRIKLNHNSYISYHFFHCIMLLLFVNANIIRIRIRIRIRRRKRRGS